MCVCDTDTPQVLWSRCRWARKERSREADWALCPWRKRARDSVSSSPNISLSAPVAPGENFTSPRYRLKKCNSSSKLVIQAMWVLKVTISLNVAWDVEYQKFDKASFCVVSNLYIFISKTLYKRSMICMSVQTYSIIHSEKIFLNKSKSRYRRWCNLMMPIKLGIQWRRCIIDQ